MTDVEYVRSWGGVIKLLGRAKRVGDKISAMVSPAFVANTSILSGVNDVFNSVFVRGNAVGDVAFYGRGAGKLATASAVVADVLDCAKHQGKHINIVWDDKKLEISSIDSASRRFFVRVASADKAAIEQNFGKVEFLEAVSADECGFITGEMTEREYKEKAEKAGNVINMIRMD